MIYRRSRKGLMIFAAAMLILTTIGGALVGSTAAQERPTLRFATNAADLTDLDPHFASATQDRNIVDMVFNGLIRYKPGDISEFEPDLATAIPEPTMNGTQQVWTFTIRDDAMCHASPSSEAYALTSADVAFSYQKAATEDTSGVAGVYAGITVAATDPTTVTFTLESPLSAGVFLPKVANYAGGYVICQKAYEAIGADGFKRQPVGTGPFRFESYTPQNSIQLVANDEYFRGAPKLAGVDFRFIADSTSRELALQSGELDVIQGLPETQFVDRLNGTEGFAADVFGVGEVVFLNINSEAAPFNDPRVREAIILAMSRESHLALSGQPVAEPVYSVVPADLVPGGLTQEQAEAAGVNYQQDLERARALLAEAGQSDLTFDLITSEQDSYRRNYEVMAEELRQVGITANVSVVQHAAMHEQIRDGVNPLVIYVAFRPTADTYLTQFFSSSGGTTNFAHYTAIDDLIVQARQASDPAQQEELWRQANTQILKDFVAFPLMYTNQVYARSENVDYGHQLVSVAQLYPGIDETTMVNS